MVLIWLIVAYNSLSTSIEGGEPEGWSEDIRLTFNDARSLLPAIAVEGDNVHVVYLDNESGGKYDLFLWYVRSFDGGITWSSPTCLVGGTPTRVYAPKIALHGDNVHVIWSQFDKKIHYMRSLDNGNTWDPEIIISQNAYQKTINWDIGVCGDNLHVIFSDINYKLTYTQSKDNGMTWSSPKILISTYSKVVRAAIAVNGSNVHITWEDGVRAGTFKPDIFYIKSEDNGLTWKPDINITGTLNNTNYRPDIAVHNDGIYVVYGHQYTNSRQVFLSLSQDNGKTWVRNIKISNSSGYIQWPGVAAEGEGVFVVWMDPESIHSKIHLRSSNDCGKTWGNITWLVNGSIYSTQPHIAVNENTIHTVWVYFLDGNYEVYYKRYLGFLDTTIDIDPDTLNLKSKGRWITAYIEIGNGRNPNDINISTILLENTVPAENHPTEIGDHDNDGIPDLMVKFDRSDVEDMLPPSKSRTLTVTGSLITGESFEGEDIIRVIQPP